MKTLTTLILVTGVAVLAPLSISGDPTPTPPPETPVAVVSGPTEANPGDIVILDAGESSGADFYRWDVKALKGRVGKSPGGLESAIEDLRRKGYEIKGPFNAAPKDHFVSSDGKTLQVASYPGAVYDVILAVSNDKGLDLVRWQVKISGDCPDDPNVPDVPDPPDGPDFDLSDDVQDWIKSVGESDRVKLPDFGKAVQDIGNKAKDLGSKEAVDEMISFTITSQFATEAQGWANLFSDIDSALAKLRPVATIEQYGTALISLGKGLQQ